MMTRAIVLSLVLLVSAGYMAHATRAEEVPVREPLAAIPLTIQGWQGRDTPKFSADIEKVLGVDEYITRIYSRDDEHYVTLYLGYYRSQRAGDTIHSPMNCLPGAGWQPVRAERADIPVSGSGGSIRINRYVIEKGVDRQVVLYWYQSHGRVVASEYWSKAFMIYDATRLNRTDAALVRVISPVWPSESDDAAAAARATEFVKVLFPLLETYLPS